VSRNSLTAGKPPSDGVISLCDDSDNDEDLLAALEESLKCVDQGANSAVSSRNLQSENPLNDYESTSAMAARSSCQTVGDFSHSDYVDGDANAVCFSRTTDSNNQSTSGTLAASSRCQTLDNFGDFGRQDAVPEEYLFPGSGVPSVGSINATEVEDLPGFDPEAGRIWIYPTNFPVREYQLRIVRQALVRNTMVTLPTGLGKTFIAAVVMYNFYRWYPTSKIVFMAPTKPLVAQQIEACHGIMGIPVDDTAEMTGQ